MTFDVEPYREMYPFSSHYLNRGDIKYHYVDEGQGETVVMLHGNPTWSFYYRSVISSLSRTHRTIVPDHIGCGLSDKPDDKQYEYTLKSRVDDLEALLEHLGIEENINFIVHDWGGMIGMAYAMRHPQKVKRFVILNTASFLMPSGKGLPWRLWLLRQILPFATVAVRGFNVFSGAATVMATKKGLSKKVKKGLTAPYNSWKNRIATLRFVQDIPIYPKDPCYDIVKEVDDKAPEVFADTPMMVCWGMHDFVFDRDYLKEWQKRFPNAEYHIFEDSGHYVLEDSQQEIVALVEKFLS